LIPKTRSLAKLGNLPQPPNALRLYSGSLAIASQKTKHPSP
jgi:hypothetical protein